MYEQCANVANMLSGEEMPGDEDLGILSRIGRMHGRVVHGLGSDSWLNEHGFVPQAWLDTASDQMKESICKLGESIQSGKLKQVEDFMEHFFRFVAVRLVRHRGEVHRKLVRINGSLDASGKGYEKRGRCHTRVIEDITNPTREDMIYLPVRMDDSLVTLELHLAAGRQGAESRDVCFARFPFRNNSVGEWIRTLAPLQRLGGEEARLCDGTLELDIFFGSSIMQFAKAGPAESQAMQGVSQRDSQEAQYSLGV